MVRAVDFSFSFFNKHTILFALNQANKHSRKMAFLSNICMGKQTTGHLFYDIKIEGKIEAQEHFHIIERLQHIYANSWKCVCVCVCMKAGRCVNTHVFDFDWNAWNLTAKEIPQAYQRCWYELNATTIFHFDRKQKHSLYSRRTASFWSFLWLAYGQLVHINAINLANFDTSIHNKSTIITISSLC